MLRWSPNAALGDQNGDSMRRPTSNELPLALAGGFVAGVAVYAWWATGVPPFTLRAYIAVGVPALVLLLVATIGPATGRVTVTPATVSSWAHRPRRVFPWLILFMLAVALESVGLALGGRSQAVPTVSTVIDHALSQHVVRFILFCVWLAAGWTPLLRTMRMAPSERDGVD